MRLKTVFWSVGVAVAMPLSANALDFSGYLRTGTGNALGAAVSPAFNFRERNPSIDWVMNASSTLNLICGKIFSS